MQHRLTRMTVIGLIVTAGGLLVVGGGATGCARRNSHAGPSAQVPMPVPSNSYVREWSNDLRLNKGDSVDKLHVRDDTVYVYTRDYQVYAIGRSGGELRYLAQPDISGGVLRPPLELGDRVVYPCGSTLEVFNNRGRPIRTIELEKPTRSGAIGSGHIV